jgi:Ca2+-binding RTX toxin-like protein
MTISVEEQYLLELMNRARLDPLGEAKRFGIALNDGLDPGTISSRAKQVLAGNDLLDTAATGHSLWMLAEDEFQHVGEGGSSPNERMDDAGYHGTTYGENIALVGSTGSITLAQSIAQLNENLFRSAGHRENTLNGTFRELGLGTEVGFYTQGSSTFNAAVLTENFGVLGTRHFLTGIAYQDADNDAFYSMGEGVSGVTFAAQGHQTATAGAGGYELGLTSSAGVAVSGQAGGVTFSLKVNMRPGNVKLDLVDGNVFFSSGSVTLISGVQDAVLLGVGNLSATGSAQDNHLTGNSGANTLNGHGGRDLLEGGVGNDTLIGGAGNDRLNGGRGADVFVFAPAGGSDRITGFSTAEDTLRLDAALWDQRTLTAAQVIAEFATETANEVVLDFGATEIRLLGLGSTAGLSGAMDIF